MVFCVRCSQERGGTTAATVALAAMAAAKLCRQIYNKCKRAVTNSDTCRRTTPYTQPHPLTVEDLFDSVLVECISLCNDCHHALDLLASVIVALLSGRVEGVFMSTNHCMGKIEDATGVGGRASKTGKESTKSVTKRVLPYM